MQLWLVRHALPEVATGTCYGQSDLPVAVAQQAALAQTLAAQLPHQVLVRTSPLQRCKQLALDLQGLRPDLMFKTEPALMEMHFGRWEGVPWAEIPQQAIDTWVADFAQHRFGGGESVDQVLQRVKSVLQKALQGGANQEVWLTHAGVIRAASVLLHDKPIRSAADWPQTTVSYGGLVILNADSIQPDS